MVPGKDVSREAQDRVFVPAFAVRSKEVGVVWASGRSDVAQEAG